VPITLKPNDVFRGQVPAVPESGVRVPHSATVVVQPALDNPAPDFKIVIRYGEFEPSLALKDLRERELTGKTARTIHWYATTTWSYPRVFGHGPWNGTRTFDLNGADPGDLYEIGNEGQTDIEVTIV